MMRSITRQIRGLFKARSGASAMEFAVLATPMVLLLFGVLEIGRLQWTRNAVEEVAAAGARCVGLASVSCSDNGSPRAYNSSKTLSYMTNEAMSWSVNVANADIVVSTAATCQGLSNFTQVTVSHRFRSGLLAIAGLSDYPIASVACYPNQG